MRIICACVRMCVCALCTLNSDYDDDDVDAPTTQALDCKLKLLYLEDYAVKWFSVI